MAHLGILTTFDHYPAVRASVRGIDGQLRAYLNRLGHVLTEVSVFDLSPENLPESLPACDLWIISGAPSLWDACDPHRYGALLRLVRSLPADAPVYAFNHGEHILHDAFCTGRAVPPSTPRMPKVVRNPFWSFWTRDRLYAYARRTGVVEALPRSDADDPRSGQGQELGSVWALLANAWSARSEGLRDSGRFAGSPRRRLPDGVAVRRHDVRSGVGGLVRRVDAKPGPRRQGASPRIAARRAAGPGFFAVPSPCPGFRHAFCGIR